MTTYRRLIERNEHEGETWCSYIPVEGNVMALTALKALLDTVKPEIEGDDPPYELESAVLSEAEVDAVVRLGNVDDGYGPAHTKLSGTLTLPDREEGVDPREFVDELLYKGGIEKLVIPS